MTFETHERGPMCISTDPTSGLSVAQRRVLQAFYAGRLTAGNLMEELRRAAAAVPSNSQVPGRGVGVGAHVRR